MIAARPSRRREPVPPCLYAIADAEALGSDRIPDAVSAMADAGVEWIQIRAKRVSGGELCNLVERSLERLDRLPTALWVDDRVDIATLFPVAGVHVGQNDLAPAAARRVVDDELWIGYSTHNEEQALQAAADPEVDVIALGPIFPTRSKENPDPVVGLDSLRRIRRQIDKPLVAIGGIDAENLASVLDSGADSVALLGAVCHGDVSNNCKRLLKIAKEAA